MSRKSLVLSVVFLIIVILGGWWSGRETVLAQQTCNVGCDTSDGWCDYYGCPLDQCFDPDCNSAGTVCKPDNCPTLATETYCAGASGGTPNLGENCNTVGPWGYCYNPTCEVVAAGPFGSCDYSWSFTECGAVDTCESGPYLRAGNCGISGTSCDGSGCTVGGTYKTCCAVSGGTFTGQLGGNCTGGCRSGLCPSGSSPVICGVSSCSGIDAACTTLPCGESACAAFTSVPTNTPVPDATNTPVPAPTSEPGESAISLSASTNNTIVGNSVDLTVCQKPNCCWDSWAYYDSIAVTVQSGPQGGTVCTASGFQSNPDCDGCGGQNTGSPQSCTWNTSGWAAGTYVLRVQYGGHSGLGYCDDAIKEATVQVVLGAPPTAVPTSLPSKTCNISTSQDYYQLGETVSVSYNGTGNNEAGEAVRAFVERSDGTRISLGGESYSAVTGNYYYGIGECNSSNFSSCSSSAGLSSTTLGPGTYYVHCDLPTEPPVTKCSGNPFCPYEGLGGSESCGGWVSCSSGDWDRFTVVSSKTCSAWAGRSEYTTSDDVFLYARGTGNTIPGTEQVRLYLERADGTSISGLTGAYVSGGGYTYYYLGSCNSTNGATCSISREDLGSLPEGEYYLHCDVPNEPPPIKCTGNPFCRSPIGVLNGNEACGDWASCGSDDYYYFSVSPPGEVPTSTPTSVATLTPSLTPTGTVIPTSSLTPSPTPSPVPTSVSYLRCESCQCISDPVNPPDLNVWGDYLCNSGGRTAGSSCCTAGCTHESTADNLRTFPDPVVAGEQATINVDGASSDCPTGNCLSYRFSVADNDAVEDATPIMAYWYGTPEGNYSPGLHPDRGSRTTLYAYGWTAINRFMVPAGGDDFVLSSIEMPLSGSSNDYVAVAITDDSGNLLTDNDGGADTGRINCVIGGEVTQMNSLSFRFYKWNFDIRPTLRSGQYYRIYARPYPGVDYITTYEMAGYPIGNVDTRMPFVLYRMNNPGSTGSLSSVSGNNSANGGVTWSVPSDGDGRNFLISAEVIDTNSSEGYVFPPVSFTFPYLNLDWENMDAYASPSRKIIRTPSERTYEPWFQVTGGGVMAVSTISDGVPPTCVTDVTCTAAVSIGSGNNENSILAADTLVIGSNGCSSGCTYGSPNNWYWDNNAIGYDDDYDYFLDQFYVRKGIGQTYGGNQVMSGLNQTGLVFVDGNVTIDSNVAVASGGFLMVVASGSITVDSTVTSVDGVWVADGGFTAAGSADNQLVINGIIYASDSGSVRLSRGYTDAGNNNSPAVLVNYRPEFLFTMPGELTDVLSSWREGL